MKKVSVSVAEAKRNFSELLGRVAYGNETITITRHGKPMAILAPPVTSEGLVSVKGWLEDDDPFLEEIQQQLLLMMRLVLFEVRLSARQKRQKELALTRTLH